MNSIANIKRQVKANIKKDEINKASLFVINFDDMGAETNCDTYKLTKNQYLQTELTTVFGKKDLKYPVRIKKFTSILDLQKYVDLSKKTIIKINSHLITNKKTMSSFMSDLTNVFYKFNHIVLNMIRLMIMLKLLNEKLAQIAN